jgi:hypothetical protein
MEEKTISKETLEKVKSLPRIDYYAFIELINQKQVKQLVKFKKPKTIFYDEESKLFLYLNPFHKEFSKCGYFYGDESLSIKELSNTVYGCLYNIKNSKAINKLTFYLENQHSINFTKDEFLKFNFTVENDEFIEFYTSNEKFIFFQDSFDAVSNVRNNTLFTIESMLKRINEFRLYN